MPDFYISLLLHFYQPPWQYKDVLKRIIDECYGPIFEYLKRNDLPLTINLNYSLIEVLEKYGFHDMVNSFGEILRKTDVTNSAAYHIIIPLILGLPNGEEIVIDQMRINREGLEKLGVNSNGFFPPEMAIDEKTISIADGNWVIADSVCFDAVNKETIPYNYIGIFGEKRIIFRSRHWSNELTLEMPKRQDYDIASFVGRLKNGIEQWFRGDGFLILAFDAETLGHHIPAYRNFLEQFFNELDKAGIKPETISRLTNIFDDKKNVKISPGSWSTDLCQINSGNYYPLWLSNETHEKWFGILRKLAEIYAFLSKDDKLSVNREMNSCIPWQVSHGRDQFFYEWLNRVENLMKKFSHELVNA